MAEVRVLCGAAAAKAQDASTSRRRWRNSLGILASDRHVQEARLVEEGRGGSFRLGSYSWHGTPDKKGCPMACSAPYMYGRAPDAEGTERQYGSVHREW